MNNYHKLSYNYLIRSYYSLYFYFHFKIRDYFMTTPTINHNNELIIFFSFLMNYYQYNDNLS